MKPSVQFFLVVAPGIDPSSVEVKPEVTPIGWKFGEMDRGDLIDQVQLVSQHISALEKWCESARGVLKQTLPKPDAEHPEVVTPGKQFEAHYTRTIRFDVDRDKVKTFVGPERYAKEFCKETEVFMLKILPIAQTPGAAG